MIKMVNIRSYPTWDALYRDANVKDLPWYSNTLDSDLEQELKSRSITKGNFLDLGTGPGTQAVELSNLGFNVTASDISRNAILKASKLSNKVEFIADDILNSKLPKKSFDYIFDRGCFHTLSQPGWQDYLKNIKTILKGDGLLFLKTFSKKEPGTFGPRRFSLDEINDIFSNDFIIESTKESVYAGTLSEYPKALFIVMRKR